MWLQIGMDSMLKLLREFIIQTGFAVCNWLSMSDPERLGWGGWPLLTVETEMNGYPNNLSRELQLKIAKMTLIRGSSSKFKVSSLIYEYADSDLFIFVKIFQFCHVTHSF